MVMCFSKKNARSPLSARIANPQLSIKDNIAATFDFANRDEVIVNIVSKESVTVDLVEITFKDQFISRGDMWRMKLSLCNECVYVNKGISFLSMRVRAATHREFIFPSLTFTHRDK